MIRRGYYCHYKGKVFACGFKDDIVLLRSNDVEDLKKRGFINNIYFQDTKDKFSNVWNTKYSKNVSIKKIKWFCSISTIGYYRGYEVGIASESEDEYIIGKNCVPADSEVFSEENGFERIDRFFVSGKVPKSEVTNITEIKKPINKKYKAPDNWDF